MDIKKRKRTKDPIDFVEEDIDTYVSGKIGAVKIARDIYNRLANEIYYGFNVLCVLQDMNIGEIDALAQFINKCQDGREEKDAYL